MQRQILTLLLLIIFSLTTFAKDKPKLFRYPALNSSGSEVAFEYQGDIWTVSSNGGEAVRRTIHEAYDFAPIWSNDDSELAFVSNRFGNNDIFVMPKKGGFPKRITYRSSNDILTDWCSDNSILFSTAREFRQVEWNNEIYTVNAKGGTPERLLSTVGEMAVKSYDGKFIAFVKGACRTSREAYKGPANKDLWIYNIEKDEYSKLTNFDGNDFLPKWGPNNTIYFLSSRQGVYNIHSLTVDENGVKNGDVIPVTKYTEDGIRYFSLSGNGKEIAFERKTDIFITSVGINNTRLLKINLGSDYRFDPIEHKKVTSKANEFSLSPNGKYTAFVVRGDIFVKENDKEKSRAVNLTNHPYNDVNVDWLSDSTLIFASDRGGNYDLYLLKSSDKNESNLFKSLKHEVVQLTNTDVEETFPVVSPDLKKVAFDRGRGGLIVAEISDDGSLSDEIVLLDGWDNAGGVTWSPDSKWLAYSLDDLDFNTEVFIHAADNSKKPVNVSMHPRGDYSPVWSKDGSKLGFISERNNSDNDIWFVWLQKEDWLRSKEDWKEMEDEKADEKKDTAKTDLVIEFENIYERIEQLTSLPGDEGNLAISADGETFYFTATNPPNKGQNLFSIKWDKSELKALTKGGKSPRGVRFDKKWKNIYYMSSGGSLKMFDVKSKKESNLPYSGKMDINYNSELGQMFDEAWRTLRDGFYDPNFHGQNWNELRSKFRPWCLAASTKTDFQYMFNEMLGQLNASHMGMYGSGREDTQNERTGLLGVELKNTDSGMLVEKVIDETPAARTESKLNVGDVINSVNGTEINSEENFYKYFVNTVNEKVFIDVTNNLGEKREVVIRPTSSIRRELYKDWVAERRKLTEEYSGGKLGYLHIQGMSWPSFETFERELTASGYGKEGIVIDVRYNGGGWTTDYLMTVLNVKQHAYTIPRGAVKSLKENKKFTEYYPYGERLPYAAWMKPSIAMCNQYSYSNAEIFSHAYKTLGIGTLVGEPTFGAVISTGGKGLIDGSYVRLPFRAWYVKATGENMEHGPAVPDIVVYNNPDDKSKGKDTQLKRAVEELLKTID